MPKRLILFAPHPDDIAISAGALAAWAASARVPTTIVLVTDGSEARLPPNLIDRHLATAEEQRRARGRTRVDEVDDGQRRADAAAGANGLNALGDRGNLEFGRNVGVESAGPTNFGLSPGDHRATALFHGAGVAFDLEEA